MNTRGCLLAVLLAHLPELASAQAAATGSSRHTAVTLVPEVEWVRPGEPFAVALRLRMEPGWHTYWKNPGDSGLATRIRWSLPEGFEAGEIEWPRPEKMPGGGLMSYGYEGEVLLLSRIRPPSGLRPGTEIALGARVEWLECQEACLPGRAQLEVRLPVRETEPRADPRLAPAFAQARALLPRPASGWRFEAATSRDAVRLSARPPRGTASPREAYFFPARPGLFEHAAPQPLARGGDGFRLTIPRAANGGPPETVDGVLVLDGTALALSVRVGTQVSMEVVR